jgi:hypothetical protein
MPTSHTGQINTLIDLIVSINPKSLLDIGVGYGKYGFLSREYLDIDVSSTTYGNHNVQIDGIEGFPQYITDLQRNIYDRIFIGNALEVIDTIETQYDLILMIDVFEHFTEVDGNLMLNKCLKKGKHVLISCPKDMNEQGAEYGNTYEEHRFQWGRKHFAKYNKVFIPNYHSLICLIGADAKEIKRNWKLKTFKIRLSAMFPRLRRWYLKYRPKKVLKVGTN